MMITNDHIFLDTKKRFPLPFTLQAPVYMSAYGLDEEFLSLPFHLCISRWKHR